jgi:hypothetical protein
MNADFFGEVPQIRLRYFGTFCIPPKKVYKIQEGLTRAIIEKDEEHS